MLIVFAPGRKHTGGRPTGLTPGLAAVKNGDLPSRLRKAPGKRKPDYSSAYDPNGARLTPRIPRLHAVSTGAGSVLAFFTTSKNALAAWLSARRPGYTRRIFRSTFSSFTRIS